jgi:hypothetical protein
VLYRLRVEFCNSCVALVRNVQVPRRNSDSHLVFRDPTQLRAKKRTLPTPLREDFGPNAKARDAIEVDFCEAFPLPEGIGESPCRQCATRSTPLGNPPSPPPRLRPQPSYVEVKRKPCVGLIVDAPETSVAPVSSLEPSAPLKGLCHHIPERLGKDTLLYGP